MNKKLVKFLGGILFGAIITLIITACGNKAAFDTVYKFDKAIINTGNEVITVQIKSWQDFEDGEYQIEATDGTVYLVHISNCTIIKSNKK